MELDESSLKFLEIFQPGDLELYKTLVEADQRFVYYTSADTALKIITNRELWFRNATVMNDFSEIQYGLQMIRAVFSGEEGERFMTAVDEIHEGTIEKTGELLSGWEFDWEMETYLACVSIHKESEDRRGRLSMWRAYGDTAIVINNTPMMVTADTLGVHSTPVRYFSEDSFAEHLAKVTNSILINRSYLQALGQEAFVASIHHMLFLIAISAKHPGFSEEQEWRLYYRPSERVSPAMTEEIVVLGGVPQKVFKLRLADEPENGLFGADIPSLLNRVIIGPSEFPYASRRAFVSTLERMGVKDANDKVIASDIPLRSS